MNYAGLAFIAFIIAPIVIALLTDKTIAKHDRKVTKETLDRH